MLLERKLKVFIEGVQSVFIAACVAISSLQVHTLTGN